MKKKYIKPTIEYLVYDTEDLLMTTSQGEGAEQDFAKENEFFFDEEDDGDFFGDNPFSQDIGFSF